MTEMQAMADGNRDVLGALEKEVHERPKAVKGFCSLRCAQ